MSVNNSFLRLTEDSRNIVQEISALSGYNQNIVKEILEYFLIDWALKITEKPDDYAELTIPYIGKIGVKYEGDIRMPDEQVKTNVSSYVELSEFFKKLVGDLHDEGQTEIDKALKRKIESAVMIASE